MILVSNEIREALYKVGCTQYVGEDSNITVAVDFREGMGVIVDGIPYWLRTKEQHEQWFKLVDFAIYQLSKAVN